MHGLLNKAIEVYARETHGDDLWQDVIAQTGFDAADFSVLLRYSDPVTRDVLNNLQTRLGRSLEDLLEDLGTFLISHPETTMIRRLLRFGGESYAAFLMSLDELPDRARLAMDDLHLPDLETRDLGENRFELRCKLEWPGFGYVLLGVLRAMADEFGTLAALEHCGISGGKEVIRVEILVDAFAEGRAFHLGVQSA